ncbi:MAG: AraC family transcriptional regulator [Pseudomonadota bacterium]
MSDSGDKTDWETVPAWARQANQPATYPRSFVTVAEARGVDREKLLQHAGVAPEALDDPAGRISLVDTWRVMAAAVALTGDTGLGFETGLKLPLTAHGSLGYALMCAPTPREAIEVLERFWHLRGRGFLMTASMEEDELFFEVIPEWPLPVPLRDAMFASMLTSICRGIQFVLPEAPAEPVIWWQGRDDTTYRRLQASLPEVRFGMPCAAVVIRGDARWLDRPQPSANSEAYEQALEQCRRESALVRGGDQVVQQTRMALVLGSRGYPTPDEVADRLHMTPRTLRRHLHEEGQSYQSLLEEARRRDSARLLDSAGLEVRRIAEWLGYTDPANFTRAFKSWTGMTPSAWRQAHRTEDD